MENIDYEALKKRGFLRQKQEGFFVLRTTMPAGIYADKHLEALKEISRKYAKGFLHLTVRQGIEIPFIKSADIPAVEAELKAAGIQIGASGPRLRVITVCPGNNWCRLGLVDTFSLAKRIEEELGIKCGLELPHKFKIAISGCPNGCTRPQVSEIGIHGVAGGYAVYLGGCGGRVPRNAFKLDKIFSEGEVLSLVAKIVEFYKKHAQPKERLGLLIEGLGRDKFLEQI